MSHYFENDKSIKSEERIIYASINKMDFKFLVDNGIFSKKGVDFGTRSLLENIIIDTEKNSILDFGCGYGPIGIYLSKLTNLKVDMIDVNERAVALAKKNANLNRVNVNVFESNLYENITETYDYIVTNPPIRVGKEILYKILFEAKKYLNHNGELWLVVNKNQGAKTLFNDLKKEYDVEIVAKCKGFYIIRAINN